MKVLIYVFIITVFTINSFAQTITWEHTGGPAGGYVRDLVKDANDNFFTATSGGLFKSSNSGDSWSLITNGIGYTLVYSLAVSPNGTMYAGTFYNKIFRSTDSGNTWLQTGNNVYFIVKAMAVNTNGDVFAGTRENESALGGGSVYRSTNDGLTWLELSGLPDSPVYQVKISADGSVFVGMKDGLFKSTDSGVSWAMLTNGIWITWISDITINPVNNYIFVSGSNQAGNLIAVFRSTDNGSSFAQLAFPNVHAHTLGVSPDGNLFAAATGFTPSVNYSIYRSTDDGNTFSKVDSTLSGKKFAFGTIPNQVFTGTNLGVHLSSDNGQNWQLKVYGMTGIEIKTIASDHSNSVYVGTFNGPYLTTDEGDNWQLLGSSIPLRAIYSITTNSVNDVFVTNDLGDVFRSTDKGSTWIQLPIEGVLGIILAHTNDMLFAAPPFQGVIRSTDNGITWLPQNQGMPPNQDIRTLASSSSGNLYAGATLGGLWRTTNNGEMWTRLGTYNGYVDVIAVNASEHVFWAYNSSPNNFVFRTTNAGITWIQLNVVPSNAGTVEALFITPDQDIYAAVSDENAGGIYRSTDNGNSFVQVSDGLTEKLLTCLGMSSDGRLFAGTTRGVFRSMQTVPVELLSFTASVSGASVNLMWQTATEINNKGFDIERKKSSLQNEWEKIGYVAGSGTSTEPVSYSFTDNNISPGSYFYRLKQIDFDGTFEYSTETEVTISLPEEFLLGQNYPNPFNPSTIIKYAIPQKEYVTLKIYNLLGKEVEVLVNEEKNAGRYEINFEPDNLSSGIYFYKLTSGNHTQTKKMILIK